MQKTHIAFLRIPAFLIDLSLITLVLIASNKIGIYLGLLSGHFAIGVLMFVLIPLGFFFYWCSGINLGKRLFHLKTIDASSRKKPTLFQYFRRCLLFSLLVSLNVLFLLPFLLSKKNQGFHDMLANTLVVRENEEFN